MLQSLLADPKETRMLSVGDMVPATDIATDTERHPLARHDGKDGIFFFRADTSGCTKETIQFSDRIDDFAAAGAEVLVFQRIPPETGQRAKYDLKCHLGADHDTDICEQFGVRAEKPCMAGPIWAFSGQPLSLHVGQNSRGLPKVKVDGHAAEVRHLLKPCN